MIRHEPLTEVQMADSRHNYNRFSLVNGLSYMCLGETVIILFAVKLQSPDYIIAILGSMIYFGFLLLPLGKVVTARVGAARSQADFWVMRNLAALLVAAAAPVALWWSRPPAIAMLLAGAFLFYGFRAAGVVMSQPLLGEICEEKKRAGFLGMSTMIFYVAGFGSMLIISVLLTLSPSVWLLAAIIVAGSCMGVTASGFIRRIDETESIRDSARRPVLPQMRTIICNKSVRRQLVAGTVMNFVLILTVPISMLALKRGYKVTDTDALLYALVQFGAASVAAYLVGYVSGRIGPRKTAIGGYWILAAVALLWLAAPVKLYWYWAVLPFLLCGSGTVAINNGMIHYFLMSVPPEKQVASSMFISVSTGAGAGICGMLAGGYMLRGAEMITGMEGALRNYRIYFAFVLVIIVLLSVFVYRLVKVIDEFRRQAGEAGVRNATAVTLPEISRKI